MAGVALRVRAELRRRWRAWLGLALLLGIAAGTATALVAGARRTETAFERGFGTSVRIDAGVFSQEGDLPVTVDEVGALPGVEFVALQSDFAFGEARIENGPTLDDRDVGFSASPDPAIGSTIEREKLVDGRYPDPAATDEAFAGTRAADAFGLDVGTRLAVQFLSRADEAALDAGAAPESLTPTGPRVELEIVGVVADLPDPGGEEREGLGLTSAFWTAYADEIPSFDVIGVRLDRDVTSIAAFHTDVTELADNEALGFFAGEDFSRSLSRTAELHADAFRLMAGLLTVVILLLFAQALSRQSAFEAEDDPVLCALGWTRGQLVGAATLRALIVGVAATLVTVSVAILLSPRFPVGEARLAEPEPGFAVSVAAVGLGATAVVLAAVTFGCAFAVRRTRAGATVGEDRPARIADRLAELGAPIVAITGVRLAIERGRARTVAPVAAVIVGVVLAVATIAGTLAFAASLDHLTDTPRLYGVAWDVQVGDAFGPDRGAEFEEQLDDDARFASYAVGTTAEVLVEGRRVGTLAVDPQRGEVGPTVVEGRLPSAPDELLLARDSMETVDAHVGDSVTVGAGESEQTMRIVGRGVLPDLAAGGASIELGEGAVMTLEGYRRLVPDAPANIAIAQFASDVSTADRARAVDELGATPLSQPSDLRDFSRVDGTPMVIGLLLGVVAVGTIVHALVSSIRRRRRDFAVLKTLGFRRGQVAGAIAWQATTIAAIGVVVGLPLGIAAGRWAWTVFADRLGVISVPVVPLLAVLAIVPGAFVVANLTAVLPARAAARTSVAAVLRSE